MSSAVIDESPGTATAATPLARPAPAPLETRLQFAVIDDSVRLPVLLFFGSAILWLLLGSTFALLVAHKLVAPGFLASLPWLTFGRLQPAETDSFVYGWGLSAGIGAGIWIMARLARTPVRHGGVLTGAWLFWNLGLTLGIFGILNGNGTSMALLEFPRYASPIVFSAFTFIAIWAVMMFSYRRATHTYISQWYLLAAFLWFPWIYATANLVVIFLPVQAPVQAPVDAWYVRSLFGVCFGGFGLGAAYYLVPKVLARPIHRYGLASAGFWTFILFSSWTGMDRLIGGPVPAWMITASIVATVLTILPLLAIGVNLLGSMQGRFEALRHSPALRFTVVGVLAFLAAGAVEILLAFRGISSVMQFTQLPVADTQLAFGGFFTMTVFGAIYYIVPRLVGAQWPSASLVRAHFWFGAVGTGLLVLMLALAGALQGFGLDDAKVPQIAIVSFMTPFLVVAWAARLLMMVGCICFTASFVLLFVRAAIEAGRGP